MKTLTMYLRAAKTEAEDAGVSTDGMANSVSELRDEILALTGHRVDIMIDDDTFKSSFQTMRELADIWDELTDVSRANILNLIGGKRNANTFSALLENFDTAIRSTTTAVDALGSATAENEKYLDSIVGKITKFKAAFEELSSTLIDSELVGGAVDFATALLEIGTALTKLQLLLPIVTAAFSGFNVIKQLPRALMDGKSLEGMLSKFSVADANSVPEIQAFISATQNYTQAQREMLAQTVKTSAEFRALDTAQQAAVLSNMNLANSAITSATGLKRLGAMAKVAWNSMSMLSKISLVISGVSAAIAAIGWVVDAFTTSMEEAQEYASRLQQSVEQYQSSTSTYKSNIQTLESLRKKYDELSIGVEENGEQASLTDEQYREYLTIVQQIADISPSVVSAYDSEGEAIALYADAIDIAIQKQNELIENQRAILLSNGKEVYNNSLKSYKEYVKTLQSDFGSNLLGDLIFKGLPRKTISGRGSTVLSEGYASVLEDAFEKIGHKINTSNFISDGGIWDTNYNVGSFNTDIIRDVIQYRKLFVGMLQESGKYTGEEIAEINNEIWSLQSTLEQLEAIELNQVEYLFAQVEDSEFGDKLSDKSLRAFKNGLLELNDPYKSYAQNTAAAIAYAEEFTRALETGGDGGSLTEKYKELAQVADYDTYVQSVNEQIKAMESEGKVAVVTRNAIEEYLLSLYNIPVAASGATTGTEQVTQSILSLSDALTQIQKNNDVLAKIYADMDSLGYVTADTISAMIKQLGEGESIMDYLTLENGMLKANADAWRERNANVFTSELKQMEAELQALKDARTAVVAGNDLVLPDAYQAKYGSVKSVEELNAAIVQLVNDMVELQVLVETVGGSGERELDLGLEDLFKGTDELREQAKTVLELLEQLKTGVPLTKDEIMDLGGTMPELALDLSAATTIEEQQAMLNAAWDGYKKQWQKIIDEQIALLTNQRAHFTEGSEEYQTLTEAINSFTAMRAIDLGEIVVLDDDGRDDKLTEELYELVDALDAVRSSAELLSAIKSGDGTMDIIDQAEQFINRYNTATNKTDNYALDWTDLVKGFDSETGTISWNTEKIEAYSDEILKAADGLAELEAKFPGITTYLKTTANSFEDAAGDTKTATQSILSLSDALSQIQDNNDALAKIYADMDALGYVTADTIESMIKQLGEGESITDYLTLENGVIKANAEAWRERNSNVFASELTQMQAELAALEQAQAAVDAGGEFILPDEYKDKYKDIEAVRTGIVQLNAEITELQAVIDTVGGSGKRELDLGLESLFEDTDELRERATTLLELMEQLKTDAPLTQDQIMDIGGSMPELALDLSAADTIEEQRKVLASAWESYKTQWQTIINEQIALLKRQLLHFSVGSEEYKSLTETIIRLSSMKSIDLGEVVTIDKDDSGREQTEELYELADALDAVRNSAELLNSIQNADKLSDTIDQAEKFINDYNTAKGLTDAQALDWTELIKGFDETTGTITWDTAKIEQYSGKILNAADGLAELEAQFPGITSYLKTTATTFEEAADSAADLGDVLDAIGNATEFRAAMADGETDILSMLEQAQAMADAYNEIKHPDDADWDWTNFANNLDTADSLENIEWSEDALRTYTDAVIDNYVATTDLAETNPELITQWKDMAYAAALAAEEADHLSGALDAISNVQSFISGMQDKDTSVFDMIKRAQAMADALNELYPEGHGGTMYTWENFTQGLDGAKAMADIQWNKDALRAYVNAMVDAYAKDTQLSEQAIQNWKDMAFAQAEAAVELQNYTDILSSMTNAGNLMKQLELDMDDDGLLTLESLSSLISMVGDKWTDMVNITENGISMKAVDSVITYLKSEIDALVAAGELDKATAEATKATFDAMIASGGETISVYDKLSDAISKVETASSLLTDIESGDGDILSMIQTAAEIAEDGGYALTDLFSIVGGEFEWSTDIIEKWADTAIDGLEGVAGVTPELIAEIKELVVAEVEAAAAAEKMQASYSNVSTTLANRPSMGDYTELTYDAYNELIELDARYASAVEYQNGVLTLNRDAYNKVTQSLLQATKAEAAANMQTIIMSKEYSDLVTAIGKLSPEQQQRLDDLNAEIMGYQVLIHELDNATNAYSRFMNASTDTDSERYSAAESMRKVIEDTLYNAESDMYGKIGREQFTAAVDFLIDPNVEVGTEGFDDALKRIDRYLTEGSEGVTNFYNDLVSEGFIVDGRLDASLQEMASGLGISMDFLRTMIDELNTYQTEENKIKVSADTGEVQEEAISAEEQLKLLKEQALKLNETLDVNHEIVIDISSAEASIGKVSSGLATLLSRLAQIGKTKVKASVDLESNISGSTTSSSLSGGNWLSNVLGSLFGKSSAGGTGNASGGRTLVGERGREIVVDPTSGTWYTVGDRGPEFVNLPEGAIVFNNLQTEELLSRGRTSGMAMAEGNAASGGLLDGLIKLGSAVGKVFSGALSDAVAQIAKDKGINTSGTSGGKSDQATGTPGTPSSGNSQNGGGGSGSQKPSLEDMQAEIEEQLNYVEHLIRHQEHLYEVSSHALDFPGMEASLSEQIRLYKQMMTNAQAGVQKLIAAGADDTSEEVQAIEETYWSAYNSLYDVIEQVNKLYVDGLNDKIDGIQGAYSNFTEMIGEMGESGSVSIDTFQQLLDHGIQYLNYLDIVNGQYVINEEAIQDLIAAEKEQLAIEQALAYIAQIRQALTDDDPERVANLVSLTNEISGNTWDLVYANAALLKTLGLTDEQYTDVLHNINTMKDLTGKVNVSLNSNTEAYDEQSAALEKILDFTEQLIKYETDEKIKAIEDQIDAFKELVEQRKEALQVAKAEDDYSKDVAERTKEIASLESRIAQLSLDDSREARAERASLEEELSKLQGKLADVQGDHAYDLQIDALDKAAEDYEEMRRPEIEALEERISSSEKLYQEALNRIETGWETLYTELMTWNVEAGSVLNNEITSNWELALEAAKQYGSYVEAITARTGNPKTSASVNASSLPVYHSGGVVSRTGVGDGDVIAVLEEGEQVLTQKQRIGLYKIVDFAKDLSARLGKTIGDIKLPRFGLVPSPAGVATMDKAVRSGNSNISFAPVVNVHLSGADKMSPAEARARGRDIGNAALEEMREAFTRHGIGGIFGSGLKP